MADVTRCVPTGDLTIFEVGEFKAQLCAALETGQPVTVDLAQVGQLDASGLQLLVAACRSESVQMLNVPGLAAEQFAQLGWTGGRHNDVG